MCSIYIYLLVTKGLAKKISFYYFNVTDLLIQMFLYAYLYTQSDKSCIFTINSGYFNLRFGGSKSQNTAWQTFFFEIRLI